MNLSYVNDHGGIAATAAGSYCHPRSSVFDVPSRILQVNCAVPTDSLEPLGLAVLGEFSSEVERLITVVTYSPYCSLLRLTGEGDFL